MSTKFSSSKPVHSLQARLTRLFKQAITYVVLASLQLGTLVQTKEAYAQYVPYGQANTGSGYVAPSPSSNSFSQSGYTNDGTLFMGGQRVANPLQFLYDSQIPGFMTITATRFTFTDNPNHGQGTLLQMAQATTAGSDSSVLLNRLYLSPTNPYVQGAPGPYPNYQTYQGVLQNAQQANFLLTNANDGKTYAFKTLTAANSQAVDLLIRELPNTPQFRAAADPLGGGTGVRVTQSGDAVALAAYLATVKPYDYSWQPNFGNTFGTTFGQNGGQNPYGGWANSNNFAPDYSEGAGPAQSFDAFIKQLRDDAVKNDKTVRSQTSANSLDLSGVNPNSLFGEGYNLFSYGSNSNPNRDLENDFLKRLQAGQLTVGSSDYLEASRIAQERYRIAYATRLETGKPLQYSVADAQRKANELKLSGINANELFGQGFDLFQFNKALRANGEAENVLLARLQNGELTPGSSEYAQATQIAQERLRQAYSLSLSPPPPKSIPKWKLIAGIVVGAVLMFVTAGAAAAFIGPMMGASLTAAGSVMTMVGGAVSVAGVAATAVGAAVGSFVGAVIGTSITTGSFSAGLQAGVNSLKGGLAGIVVNTALAMAGISAGGMQDAVGGALGVGAETAGRVSSAIYSTISGSITNTLIGNGNFGQNLVSGAINGVVSVVAAQGANYIAGADLGAVGTEVAHGALGCATGMVRAGSGDGCVPGAVGAVAGHLVAPVIFGSGFDPLGSGTVQGIKDSAVFFSGVVGGAVASAVGVTDQVNQNYGLGSAAGSNAAENNALGARGTSLPQDLRACNNSSNPDSCFASLVVELNKREAVFDAQLSEACGGANASYARCNELMSNAGRTAESISQASMTANTPEQRQYLQELEQRQAASIAQYQNNLNALAGGASAADLTIATAVDLGPAAVAGVAGIRGAKPAGSGAVQNKPSVATPISAPNNFETRNVNGMRIYVNKDTGMVMVPNPANHGGQSYNIWPSVSSYNKNPNNRSDSVWADTGISRGR